MSKKKAEKPMSKKKAEKPMPDFAGELHLSKEWVLLAITERLQDGDLVGTGVAVAIDHVFPDGAMTIRLEERERLTDAR
jgi:hypothetical protein